MISNDPSLCQKLRANTIRFRTRMTNAGFKIRGDKHHPVAPVMLGDAKLSQQIANDMLEKGIYVIGFFYPVVPKNEARIRVQLSAAHEFEHVDRAVDAFVEVGLKHGVI